MPCLNHKEFILMNLNNTILGSLKSIYSRYLVLILQSSKGYCTGYFSMNNTVSIE